MPDIRNLRIFAVYQFRQDPGDTNPATYFVGVYDPSQHQIYRYDLEVRVLDQRFDAHVPGVPLKTITYEGKSVDYRGAHGPACVVIDGDRVADVRDIRQFRITEVADDFSTLSIELIPDAQDEAVTE